MDMTGYTESSRERRGRGTKGTHRWKLLEWELIIVIDEREKERERRERDVTDRP